MNLDEHPQIDPLLVAKLAPQILVQLAKLVRAIMVRSAAGDQFDRSIHVEAGNATALLVKTVKQETENAERPAKSE